MGKAHLTNQKDITESGANLDANLAHNKYLIMAKENMKTDTTNLPTHRKKSPGSISDDKTIIWRPHPHNLQEEPLTSQCMRVHHKINYVHTLLGK